MAASSLASALHGLTVLERGWLSSNNVLLHDDAAGTLLVDSGHCVHAAQTVDLVRHALAGRPLARVLNTHLHSDHCGGNAALQRAFGVDAAIPPMLADAVAGWDEDRLTYRLTGQRCEPFRAAGRIVPGQQIRHGGRVWEVLAAPGHDPASVMLFDSTHGVLVSADALWENGFGIVFPVLDGEDAFDAVAQTLDAIARLPVACVIPGHGPVFGDVDVALQRARRRLAGFQADASRHTLLAAKVLLKYHLMEEQSLTREALHAWAAATPAMQRLHGFAAPAQALRDWVDGLVLQLRDRGALALHDDRVLDRAA